MTTTAVNNTANGLPYPEVITVERKMYHVPRDATIPGGMIYRHTGGHLAFGTEYVADTYGLTPDERAGEIDFYTYEKVESPEPKLAIQGGLVLGNVRFAYEGPDSIRPVVMFLNGGRVAVAYPDGEASFNTYLHWSDFNPSQNDMVFDVIFDPEHDTAAAGYI